MVPRDLLTAPRCAPSYKPHVSEWSEIRLWMREPISLSPEVFLARNPRQNPLRFFWPRTGKTSTNELRPTVHPPTQLVKGNIVAPWPFAGGLSNCLSRGIGVRLCDSW
jgi:hypothetical protein